jgi:hypothetical protein
MSNVNLLSNLSLYGALIMEVDNSGWPANPKLGTFIMKDSNLYGYLKIGGLETWYPFSHHTVSYIHTQAMPSTTWVVNHGLGTSDLFVQVKDTAGNIIGVGKEDIDSNSFRLTFTSAITGTVIVVAPDSIDVPEIKAQTLNIGSGSVVINNGGIDIAGGIITANPSTSLTLAVPTAALMDSYFTSVPVNHGVDWVIINNGTSTVVLTSGTNHNTSGNSNGSMTVASTTSARFRSVRLTTSPTWRTYRIS